MQCQAASWRFTVCGDFGLLIGQRIAGRTCKEVGAMRQYVQSHAQDELLKIYRREYKRRFA